MVGHGWQSSLQYGVPVGAHVGVSVGVTVGVPVIVDVFEEVPVGVVVTVTVGDGVIEGIGLTVTVVDGVTVETDDESFPLPQPAITTRTATSRMAQYNGPADGLSRRMRPPFGHYGVWKLRTPRGLDFKCVGYG